MSIKSSPFNGLTLRHAQGDRGVGFQNGWEALFEDQMQGRACVIGALSVDVSGDIAMSWRTVIYPEKLQPFRPPRRRRVTPAGNFGDIATLWRTVSTR